MDEHLLQIKNMITAWYEIYRKFEPRESSIYMFMDLISKLVDTYLAELYRTNSIAPEDYLEVMAYCEELINKLKKEFGLEDSALVWNYIKGC
jgi:hypothetical protein